MWVVLLNTNMSQGETEFQVRLLPSPIEAIHDTAKKFVDFLYIFLIFIFIYLFSAEETTF